MRIKQATVLTFLLTALSLYFPTLSFGGSTSSSQSCVPYIKIPVTAVGTFGPSTDFNTQLPLGPQVSFQFDKSKFPSLNINYLSAEGAKFDLENFSNPKMDIPNLILNNGYNREDYYTNKQILGGSYSNLPTLPSYSLGTIFQPVGGDAKFYFDPLLAQGSQTFPVLGYKTGDGGSFEKLSIYLKIDSTREHLTFIPGGSHISLTGFSDLRINMTSIDLGGIDPSRQANQITDSGELTFYIPAGELPLINKTNPNQSVPLGMATIANSYYFPTPLATSDCPIAINSTSSVASQGQGALSAKNISGRSCKKIGIATTNSFGVFICSKLGNKSSWTLKKKISSTKKVPRTPSSPIPTTMNPPIPTPSPTLHENTLNDYCRTDSVQVTTCVTSDSSKICESVNDSKNCVYFGMFSGSLQKVTFGSSTGLVQVGLRIKVIPQGTFAQYPPSPEFYLEKVISGTPTSLQNIKDWAKQDVGQELQSYDLNTDKFSIGDQIMGLQIWTSAKDAVDNARKGLVDLSQEQLIVKGRANNPDWNLYDPPETDILQDPLTYTGN